MGEKGWTKPASTQVWGSLNAGDDLDFWRWWSIWDTFSDNRLTSASEEEKFDPQIWLRCYKSKSKSQSKLNQNIWERPLKSRFHLLSDNWIESLSWNLYFYFELNKLKYIVGAIKWWGWREGLYCPMTPQAKSVTPVQSKLCHSIKVNMRVHFPVNLVRTHSGQEVRG